MNSDSYNSFIQSPHLSLKHSTYFPVYDYLFSPFKGKEITFVEIGVLNGGSLFMWQNYLGPQARIIGIDLNPAAKVWEKEGFEIFIGDQSDETFWLEFYNQIGNVDVLLDDGGHSYLQQVVSVEMALKHINPLGLIVVEDTHTSYMLGFGSRGYSFVNYVKSMIDRINFRFHGILKSNMENRVWSVQTFDSIVAFHISKESSWMQSKFVSNMDPKHVVNDFRFADNKVVNWLEMVKNKSQLIIKLPWVRFIGRSFRHIIISIQNYNRLKKYKKLFKQF